MLPMHLKKALQRADRRPGRKDSTAFREAFIRFRDTRFRTAVQFCFEHRYSTVLATICGFLIALTLMVSGRVGFEFFPSAESDMVFGNFAMTPGTPRDKTEEMVEELARAAIVAEDHLTDGQGGIFRYHFGAIGTHEGRKSESVMIGDHLGAYAVELVSGDDRDIRTVQFMQAWQAEIRPIAGLENLIIYERTAAGPPGRALDIRLHGAGLDVLKEVALIVRQRLANIPGVMAVEDNLPFGKEEIVMKVTPAGLAMGFTTQSVARQVRNAYEGAVAKRFSESQEEIIVRVKLDNSRQSTRDSIRELYLRSPGGTEVPLTEVVSLATKVGYSQIRREDGLRQVSVTADVDTNISTTNAVLAVAAETIAPAIEREFGVRIDFKGKAEEQQAAVADTLIALILAVITMYVILAWVFSNYTTPFVVMSIIPLGFIGAIFGHWILGYNVSMFSLEALLGLIRRYD